jgi:protein HIRA/HIR1
VKQQRAVYPPISIAPILQPSACDVLSATVRANGCPVLQLSSGVAHSYDPGLSTWIKLSDKWWMEGSEVWQGRGRGNNTGARGHGIVAAVEQGITELMRGNGVLDNEAYNGAAAAGEKPRPTWWSAAMTLGHLESKLAAAKVLDSAVEYKQVLLVYAQRIANEGFRSKAEELVKELFGPVYWYVAGARVSSTSH